jgi:hypothetical protein
VISKRSSKKPGQGPPLMNNSDYCRMVACGIQSL